MTQLLPIDREYEELLDDPDEEYLAVVMGDHEQHNETGWTDDEGEESGVEYEDNAAEFDE